MLLIHLNPKAPTPLFKQIFLQLKELIDKQVLKPGDRLPPQRKFSEHLGVHRTTVSKAYEELWAMGYLESRQGSYSTVRKRLDLATAIKDQNQAIISWEKLCNPQSRALYTFSCQDETPSQEKVLIDFRPLSPDPELMPIQDFRHCLNQVLIDKGASLLGYGDPMGYLPLRQIIAKRMQEHRISVSPQQVLLTNGAQNGIDLILQLLVEPGRRIAVESPSYSSALPLFRFRQADITGIPMKENGMDLESLENCFKTQKPALVYTIPNFQNPTGLTSTQEHREKLLALCERYQVPLVEDGFEEEMKYFGKVILPIKSMDKNSVVLYLGTFSKVLFPGLRIGWIAADKNAIQRLKAIKKSLDLPGNMHNQAALHRFCQTGQYELHIRRIHRVYKKRMDLAIRALRKHLPREDFNFSRPNGGYTLWIEYAGHHLTENEIVTALLNEGIGVSPGSLFYLKETATPAFRISIANRNEKEIEEGIQKLGRRLKKLKENAASNSTGN